MTVPSQPQSTLPIDIAELIERARAHWRGGQAQAAEMACRQALAVWPGQADALHLLGIIAHAFGNLDLAVAYVRQACQAPTAPAVYFSDFAEMCRQRGLLAEGEQAGRRAVALAPNFPGGWNNLGIILQESGKLDQSRLYLERALTLEPDNAEAHNNLGNTFKRLGLPAEAEKHWNAALALKPDYADVYSNIANLLIDQGAYDRAEAAARRAIELNPHSADAYLNLAGMQTLRHRHAEALRWLEALTAFAPMHAQGLAAKALTLRQLERLDEALDAANLAVAMAPEAPESHNALGQVLQALGRFEPALAAYDRAAGLTGLAQEDAVSNRAMLFIEFGRKEEAKDAFDAATTAFPNSASILFNQSDLRHYSAGDPQIEKMEGQLARSPWLSLTDRTMLHFALGKVYLDLCDSERAFEHFHEGNRLKRSTYSYDPDATERWMASITKAFSPDLMGARASEGAHSSLPVFVLGMPRSGTTLIEQILASHSDVQGAGELQRLHSLVDRTGDFPASIPSLPPEQLASLGSAYLASVAPLAGARQHLVDKMPSNFLFAGLIRLTLPDARIIHCRRDPVDTCLSCYTKLFAGEQAFTYDQTELGRFHRAYQTLMAHWRVTLPSSHFLEVDYEAVVDDIESQARRMLAFLGLRWEESCLRFYETERSIRTASANQVRQPPYKSSSGRWRAHAAHLRPLLAALAIDDA